MTVDREMPPQSCCTSSTVYFSRLRSRLGLICGWFDVFASIVHSGEPWEMSLLITQRWDSENSGEIRGRAEMLGEQGKTAEAIAAGERAIQVGKDAKSQPAADRQHGKTCG